MPAKSVLVLVLFCLWTESVIGNCGTKSEEAMTNYCHTYGEPRTKPQNCLDVRCKGKTESGIERIYPCESSDRYVEVYCDQKTDDGGWMVISRRMDGSQDFFLEWDSYKHGFGDKMREFWLGNDLIHEFTQNNDQTIRIDMKAKDGDEAYAVYETFSVAPEDDKYRLHVEGYSGTAGDAWLNPEQLANGMAFSTKDKDNDFWNNNSCAVHYTGAWWYNKCHVSNLNGQYLNGVTESHATGVIWHPFKGHYNSLVQASMKIRPKL